MSRRTENHTGLFLAIPLADGSSAMTLRGDDDRVYVASSMVWPSDLYLRALDAGTAVESPDHGILVDVGWLAEHAEKGDRDYWEATRRHIEGLYRRMEDQCP